MPHPAHETNVELTEHWDLIDRNIAAVLLEMATDIDDGSPAGQLYGESLANALAVYLLERYAVRPLLTPKKRRRKVDRVKHPQASLHRSSRPLLSLRPDEKT